MFGPAEDSARPRKRRPSAISTFLDWRMGLAGVAALVVGALMPPNGIGASICAMNNMTGLPCPGCGLTRSVSSIEHGEFALAWAYHPGGYFFALLFVALALSLFVPKPLKQRLIENPPISDRTMGTVTGVLILILFAFGSWRMLVMSKYPPKTPWWTELPARTQP